MGVRFEDRGLPPVGMGPAIRAARERAGLGARAAAREIGISDTYLANLEAGLRRPSVSVAEGLARVLPFTDRERARVDEAAVSGRGRDHPGRRAA